MTPGKVAENPPPERAVLNPGVGVHIAMLAICWDDWDLDGGREYVQAQMDRK